MKPPRPTPAAGAGFTLIEVMISMTIAVLAMGMALSTFLFGLRMMYKDNVRLETNASLRAFMAQISKETLDASEFHLFPSYEKLDGDVDLLADVSPLTTDPYGADIAHGDCVVLVTRTAVTSDAKVRKFRIYYRVVTEANHNDEATIRFYASPDWGAAGNNSPLTTLLNAVNLVATPQLAGSKQLADRAKGRRIGATSAFYPIFSSEAPTVTANNESFSINVEFINGSTANNLLSSSSFNYTVSPRR